MGLLIDGQWHDHWYDTKKTGGRFVRADSGFRQFITANGSSGFKAEAGRYHLYVSLACPWAHRTLIVRKLKGLDDLISVSVVHPDMLGNGWELREGPGCIPDTVNGLTFLHEAYTTAKGDYSGRVTVPVLWDKERRTIVSNESSEIIRMLGTEFDGLGAAPGDLYPEALRAEIDAVNERVYDTLSNGVYKCGFASTQEAYDEAFEALFDTMGWLDERLGQRRYLVGEQITEADGRLFTTMVRFDAVYVGHFKCNLRRVADYENLWPYTRELFQVPGVAETVSFEHIKRHYYFSHETVNPRRIVPGGPAIDFTAPHSRGAKMAG